MVKIEKITNKIDILNEKVGLFSGWLCLGLVLLTVEQVFARYIFNAPSNAMEELKWHIFGTIILLSGAFTLHEDGHVRVDVFYHKFSIKRQILINTLGTIFFLIPSCLFIFFYGINFAKMAYILPNPLPDNHYSLILAGGNTEVTLYSIFSFIEKFFRTYFFRGEISSDQGGLGARWIIKAMIPLGFFLFTLQGISIVIKNILKIISLKE